MRSLILAGVFAFSAMPVIADGTSGTVLAFDRKANLLVLTDKTVWSLETLKEVPEGLKAGDVVEIEYRSNADNGWSQIHSVVIKS